MFKKEMILMALAIGLGSCSSTGGGGLLGETGEHPALRGAKYGTLYGGAGCLAGVVIGMATRTSPGAWCAAIGVAGAASGVVAGVIEADRERRLGYTKK